MWAWGLGHDGLRTSWPVGLPLSIPAPPASLLPPSAGADCSTRLLPACHLAADLPTSIPQFGHFFHKNCQWCGRAGVRGQGVPGGVVVTVRADPHRPMQLLISLRAANASSKPTLQVEHVP